MSLILFVVGLMGIMIKSPRILSNQYLALSTEYDGDDKIFIIHQAIQSDMYNARAWYVLSAVMNNIPNSYKSSTVSSIFHRLEANGEVSIVNSIDHSEKTSPHILMSFATIPDNAK